MFGWIDDTGTTKMCGLNAATALGIVYFFIMTIILNRIKISISARLDKDKSVMEKL